MQEDGFDTWTAENLDRKDLLAMWKSITHTLISTGYVIELYQELDHASRTSRKDPSSGENNRSACGYDNEESINGDMVILSPGESDIEDVDLCDISPNFIAEAADLSHHHSPLLSFEDILAPRGITTSGRRARRRRSFNWQELND
ncbi:uncharacterized protein K444DRAFT_635907 [Hyaloscypha bicolor E]|uniref:Uncharacterized protein n=1 Tax=Hyaloscypha bicolor E TaxID=1095630 RepID=A0A2J6SQE4_9HELO|nr:uncharacterized protein K444DRAFT_635907 [Hyaloscypha bicolor E]PMD52991.1 hypothetical protein K444DRAFT_635907 [Hyaloscypha bicolor E]